MPVIGFNEPVMIRGLCSALVLLPRARAIAIGEEDARLRRQRRVN